MNRPVGTPLIVPEDDYNRELIANVHPPEWVNPTPAARYNLVVIGGGTAGLVSAAGAAGLGARVALVERHLLGGDCLNVGCVPSKAVIRSARFWGEVSRAEDFGGRIERPAAADFPDVMERMRRLRARISHHDSARRFQQLGVDVFLGDARFTSPETVAVGGATLRFKRAVIATGARAAEPEIEGLRDAGFLTNETVFSLTEKPQRLAVIGGGPIGCELSQAFRRLGCEVTLLHRHDQLLDREDEDTARVVEHVFRREGIRLVLGCRIDRVRRAATGKTIQFESNGRTDQIDVDQILVGAGRAPNVEGLGLEAAGVRYDAKRGVAINDRLQTSNRRIYAAGDICMEHKFTHAADAAARIVIQNALFFGRRRLSGLTIPWCTYTDPEIAHVGISERDARARGIEVDTYMRPMAEVDRAIVDGEDEGFVKIHTKKGSDRIVGGTVVARHAGDMISEVALAMAAGFGLGRLASVIHPYPTQAEAIRQAGDAYNRTRLTPRVKSLFRRWLEWTR